VARQAGVPVSLHGTGGAWMVVAPDADTTRFRLAVLHSLDRKVCNSLNVCCIVRQRAAELIPDFVGALRQAADRRGTTAHLHVTAQAAEFLSSVLSNDSDDSLGVTDVAIDRLGEEWEWDSSPEVSLHVVDSVAEAIALCNRVSPRFVATLISESSVAHDDFYEMVDAPFVGDGMTRWVDGQYALNTPELGLSNWEAGRLLARGGILSGDSVYTVRYRAQIIEPDLHR
jgi:glutamate-5-semialdehyde dehydrogenase